MHVLLTLYERSGYEAIRHATILTIELTLGHMENVFDNGSMTMTFNIPKVHEGLGGHAKDLSCA